MSRHEPHAACCRGPSSRHSRSLMRTRELKYIPEVGGEEAEGEAETVVRGRVAAEWVCQPVVAKTWAQLLKRAAQRV